MAEKRLCMSYEQVESIEGDIRDILNWIATFKQEYDIPAEVEKTLNKKLEALAKKVGNAK
jgi:hypothetical protein